ERASRDHDLAARNRDVRVAKLPIRTEVAHAQFRDLAGSAGGGVLVALAAGLGVVERAQPVADLLDFVEGRQIGFMGRVIDEAVALVVEGAGRLRRGWG